ncbi:AAA ATPase-like protein [Promicromonospora sp. AC04]|uniref:AAA family ATPase n=1 Tax=Promicromonospora sp. AC04 TaxID=2135723 RepID=UPI000D467612|nr:AAA family ATPase [Promicromonospora sp. AC04]PUB20220.1 AAA ATPase-like protein [Promicromonospora sp. AC04]
MTSPTTSPRGIRSVRSTDLGHRLELARQRAFVGRGEQAAAFRTALTSDFASTVLFVHGAGGTGKTTLLRRFANEAELAGRRVVRTRRFHPATSADTLVAELSAVAVLTPAEAGASLVLLIDDFDDLHPAEPWLREELLPALPLGTVVVLAGRTPPALEWTTDPGWQELLSVHELGDLSPAEAGRLLDRRSVPRDQHARLLAITDGNPLALCVAIDTLSAGGSDDDVRLAVAHVVLQRVVGSLPTPAHREALELCAATDPTTEGHLSAAGDATELFRWLRSLPFVDAGPRGLHLRSFVREAITFERRWRSPGPAGDPPAGDPGRLSREAFDLAVREALRSWRRPDLLATNPLTSSRLVAESAEPDRVVALRAVLQTAVDGLSEDPRESKGHRAVLATYLGGAPTQEAAAERLGLPFSTYRRHLAQGLTVLASLLWWQETRGGLPG